MLQASPLYRSPSQQGQSPSDSEAERPPAAPLYLGVSSAHAHLQGGDLSRSSPGQLVVVTSQGDADTEVGPPNGLGPNADKCRATFHHTGRKPLDPGVSCKDRMGLPHPSAPGSLRKHHTGFAGASTGTQVRREPDRARCSWTCQPTERDPQGHPTRDFCSPPPLPPG